ncbi:hypothetical protein ACFOOP_02085 [Marinicaulis aureus]|uniref:Uncharacterized protein n=1 Tax=Hyphococcus aureus TaxID=2666033 RepID=A0ABW1KY15_9PROT
MDACLVFIAKLRCIPNFNVICGYCIADASLDEGPNDGGLIFSIELCFYYVI